MGTRNVSPLVGLFPGMFFSSPNQMLDDSAAGRVHAAPSIDE
jgi:hypothetical protein